MYKPNSWIADQIVYAIFPDRFAIGKPYTSESKLQQSSYHRATDYVTRHWNELPVNPSRGKDFFGGDLRGVIDHLDHLQELGVTTIFLTPIFSAPSNHKYDTTDFFTVDEQFGGKEALKDLIQHLHDAHMHLILDAAFNHVSDIHPWFLAARRGESPFKDFFTFNPDGSYQCWRDFRQMPELNLTNNELQDILYRNTDSVLQKYLALGSDGWRFDVAMDLGLATARAMRQAIRQRFPDAVMIGEIMNYGGEWTNGNDKYHGVMNYYFRDALLSWLRGEISARQMNFATEEYYQGYGVSGALCSWNILSSHDTPRLKSILPDQDQRKLAVVAQFTLPGVPLVYYGEEIGMEGGHDPDCRRPMIWDKQRWDMETFGFYKELIKIRQSRPELQYGKFIMLGHKLDAEALAFIRHTEIPNQVSLVVINNSHLPLKQRLFTPHSHLYHQLPMRNLLCPDRPLVRMEAGNLDLDILARSAAIFVPDDDQYREYKFFKPRNLL